MKEFDYCSVMKHIENNPKDTVSMTVREYIGLGDHLQECQECWARCLRIDDANPNKNQIGFNPN